DITNRKRNRGGRRVLGGNLVGDAGNGWRIIDCARGQIVGFVGIIAFDAGHIVGRGRKVISDTISQAAHSQASGASSVNHIRIYSAGRAVVQIVADDVGAGTAIPSQRYAVRRLGWFWSDR